MRIELWADVVCPFCYLGKRRLERALGGFEHREEIQLVHRAFQLDPSLPPEKTLSQLEILMSKYRMGEAQVRGMQQKLEQTAAQEGLDMKLVGGLTGNTADAHRLVLFARDRGLEQPMLERLYRAHFTEQRSIFQREALLSLAADVGLGADDVSGMFASDAHVDTIRADGARARKLGATGVPFLLIDEKVVVSGAQPLPLFTQALDSAWSASHASA